VVLHTLAQVGRHVLTDDALKTSVPTSWRVPRKLGFFTASHWPTRDKAGSSPMALTQSRR
jgi:hypothetical protein